MFDRFSLAFLSMYAAAYAGAATTTELNRGYITSAFADGCDPTTEVVEQFDNKHHYRRIEPRHCKEVGVKNPVFVVTVPSYADLNADMELTLIPPDNAPEIKVKFRGARLILPAAYQLSNTGLYSWYVTYKKAGENKWASTSVRKFLYRDETKALLTPGSTVRKALLGEGGTSARKHPRLVPRANNTDVMSPQAFLAKIADSDYSASFKKFREDVKNRFVTGDPGYNVTEPASKADAGDESFLQKRAIEQLALEHYLAPADSSYITEAKRRLFGLASWSTDLTATTSEWNNDQANRNVYYSLALGLDMFADVLNGQEKDVILKALKKRLATVITSMENGLKYPPTNEERGSLTGNPYDSHLLTATLVSLDTIMLASGVKGATENFEAQDEGKLVEDGWNRLITTLGTWGGGSDSGYANSTYYTWMALDWYGRSFTNYMLMTGQNVTSHPAFKDFHNNFLAFTSRNTGLQLMSPFGDGAEDTTLFKWNGFTYYKLYALLSGKALDRWYYQPSEDAVSSSKEALLPLQAYFLRALKDPVPLETQSPGNNYLFEDAGIVAMHSNFQDPLRSSLYFRSSRFSSFNHSHADNNAFTFVSKGRDIFVSGGWYKDKDIDFYGRLHGLVRSTRFKNALTYCSTIPTSTPLTCAGMGQSEPSGSATLPGEPNSTLSTPGKLINYHVKDAPWSVVTGDATLSYSGLLGYDWVPALDTAIRSIAYNRTRGIVVIYDWGRNSIPIHWQENLQTLVNPTIVNNSLQPDPNGRNLLIQPRKNNLNDGDPVCLRYHGRNGKFVTQSMTDITKQAEGRTPAQYHTTYTHEEKSDRTASIIVITEKCQDINEVRVTYDTSGPGITVQVNGSPESVKFVESYVKVIQ